MMKRTVLVSVVAVAASWSTVAFGQAAAEGGASTGDGVNLTTTEAVSYKHLTLPTSDLV